MTKRNISKKNLSKTSGGAGGVRRAPTPSNPNRRLRTARERELRQRAIERAGFEPTPRKRR